MMNKQYFQDYFTETIEEITQLNGGLTNDNYLIKTANKSYFFRQPDLHLAELFDRQLEGRILKLIQTLDIDLPYLFFDEKSGVKISPYYDDLLTFSQYQNSDALILVADTLKKLHSLQRCCGVDFDYPKKLVEFQKVITAYPYDLTVFSYLLEDYQHYTAGKTICHNDCVDGNLLFRGNRNYLIDYEYAADNYPIFDLTSFATENDLSAILRGEFYQLYYGSIDTVLYEELCLFEKLHHYLWCHWALMMKTIKKETVYDNIADSKYSRLKKYQPFEL